jgi:hypothetical protein
MMFEVIPHGNGLTWRMICAAGRVLVYTSESFPCMIAAAEAAKAYRVSFWRIADQVDHRMARCI